MAKSLNNFQRAVEATPDIANGYKPGLSALGIYSSKISVDHTSLIEGSVDIDTCTTNRYPNASRWDYVFSYNGKAYFVEVHSAKTDEVSTVLRKLQWLKDWLRVHAPQINSLKASKPFYWIQSRDFAIPRTSPQYRKAITAGLKPIPRLNLLK
jgi:hypothetical protein